MGCKCNCMSGKEETKIEVEHQLVINEKQQYYVEELAKEEPPLTIMVHLEASPTAEFLTQAQSLFKAYLCRRVFESECNDKNATTQLGDLHELAECAEESEESEDSFAKEPERSVSLDYIPPAAPQPEETYIELQELQFMLSDEAKEKHDLLGAYEFLKDSAPGVSWKGPTRLADGSVYVGEWNEQGEPHGNGTMYYVEGGICEGAWEYGKLNGEGRRISRAGDLYLGNWVDGKKSGKGRIEFALSGNKYEGD